MGTESEQKTKKVEGDIQNKWFGQTPGSEIFRRERGEEERKT